MENPGFTGDGDTAPKGAPDVANNKPEIKNGVEESDVPEALRYSAEKKALEALEDAVILNVPRGPADKPYAGMGKEDLLRFSQTPFWNRFRMVCTLIFWLVWLGLLGAVIGLTVTFPQCKPPPDKAWYETSVFYQIYVRSFYDSDGDGIGDINGIRSKLDYLESVDVGAIVLSSIYESHPDGTDNGPRPQADYGYEVINHNAIDETYGTMDDFLALLGEAHDLGIKVIMEFIPNYTGTMHPWFISSSYNGSQTNPWWNYYVWADCTSGPPNNWLSVYSESAWSNLVPPTNRCYLHQFLNTQPELNLRSASVQNELEMILRFWLDLGVDGFRVVKTKYLFEDADMRNEPTLGCTDMYECYTHSYTSSQEEIYPLVANWRAVLDEYTVDDIPRILLTDAMDNVNNSMMYYGQYGPDGAQLPINYVLTEMNMSCNARCVYNLIDSWVYGVPSYGTANWMSGTQDTSRLGDVIPQESWNDWGYQNAVTLLKLTLPGVALMYYGEEIGMTNVNSTYSDGTKDPAGQFNLAYSRDPYRSPMQWTNGSNGGFINDSLSNDTVMVMDPWLPVGDNLYNISVEAQNGTENSPFEFYTTLTSLRRTSETFYVGALHYTLLTDDIISYYREYEGKDSYLIAINFGTNSDAVNIADSHYDVPGEAEVVMTTRGDMDDAVGDMAGLTSLTLRPGDGLMVRWEYVRPDGKPNS